MIRLMPHTAAPDYIHCCIILYDSYTKGCQLADIAVMAFENL
jgi:hypothetical protein